MPEAATLPTIVLIEDNPLDAHLVLAAIRAKAGAATVRHFDDGDRGLAHVLTAPDRPALLLLDLNLPGTDGRDILAAMQMHSRAAQIPVVVVTSSDLERDVRECREMGAAGYVCKPMTAAAFKARIERTVECFLEGAPLPWPATHDDER